MKLDNIKRRHVFFAYSKKELKKLLNKTNVTPKSIRICY